MTGFEVLLMMLGFWAAMAYKNYLVWRSGIEYSKRIEQPVYPDKSYLFPPSRARKQMGRSHREGFLRDSRSSKTKRA